MIYWIVLGMYATGVIALTLGYENYAHRRGELQSHGKVVDFIYACFVWLLLMLWPLTLPICGAILRRVMRKLK